MVNKNDDWHRERRVGEAVKAGIKCFCGSEAYRDILEVTMNCETYPRVHRIFCPNCGLQMRSPDRNDDDFIVRQWRDISDLHKHRKVQEPVEPVMDIDTWKCGNCGHTLEHQQLLGDNVLFHEQYNYCPECGQAVKWK